MVVAAYDGEGKEVHLTQNDIDLPPGWEWTSRWTVDLQTSATDDGQKQLIFTQLSNNHM